MGEPTQRMIKTNRPIPSEKIKLLIFDLDGTLVDSRQDLSNSINAMLRHYGKAELPWVEDLCRAVADHAALLAAAEDASFQNKVHLAMAGRGWDDVKTLGAKN